MTHSNNTKTYWRQRTVFNSRPVMFKAPCLQISSLRKHLFQHITSIKKWHKTKSKRSSWRRTGPCICYTVAFKFDEGTIKHSQQTKHFSFHVFGSIELCMFEKYAVIVSKSVLRSWKEEQQEQVIQKLSFVVV